MKTFLLLFGLAGAAGSMYATPILYTFDFTGGSPNPTGSFDYDSGTNTFSNVMITWDGVQQPSNWTTIFNQSGGDLCSGVSAPAATFLGLTQDACGGVAWDADVAPMGGPEEFDLNLIFNSNLWQNSTFVLSSAPIISTSGTVSASAAAPEPGSVGLCLAGAALLAWKRRQRATSGVS